MWYALKRSLAAYRSGMGLLSARPLLGRALPATLTRALIEMVALGGLIQHLADKLHAAFTASGTGLPASFWDTTPIVVWQVDLGACPGQHRYWRRVDDNTLASAPNNTSEIQQSDDGSTWTTVLSGGIAPLPTNLADVDRWIAGMAADALGWVTHHFGLQVCPGNPTITAPAPDVTSPPEPDRITNNPTGPSVVLTPTDEEPPGAGAYRATLTWVDVDGERLVTMFDATSYDAALALVPLLESCSRAKLESYAVGLLAANDVVPSEEVFHSVADLLPLIFDCDVPPAGGAPPQARLILPAPDATLLYANQSTLDPAAGSAAALIAAALSTLLSDVLTPANAYVAGLRTRQVPYVPG